MSYSAPHLSESGLVIPTYQERLDDLIAGFKAIFGEDVYLEPDSMTYQHLALIAKCWDDLTSVLIDTYNAHNPNYASGTSLDILVPLNGLRRHEATQSSCTLQLTGQPGESIASGCQAIDTAGYIWEIPNSVTFDNNGAATVTAICTTYGAISAGVGTITGINTPVPNWYSVTNTEIAITGNAVETDAQLRKRRSQSFALSAIATKDALWAALANLDGVTSTNLVSNDTGTDALIPAHSICAVVSGGSDADIARTLWLKKSPGVATYGTSTAEYIDTYGQTNVMRFTRPTMQSIQVTIIVAKVRDFESTVLTEDIPAAIGSIVNALDIGEGLVVSTLYGAAYGANTMTATVYSITSITASGAGQTGVTSVVTAEYYEQLCIDASSVSVVESPTGTWTVVVG